MLAESLFEAMCSFTSPCFEVCCRLCVRSMYKDWWTLRWVIEREPEVRFDLPLSAGSLISVEQGTSHQPLLSLQKLMQKRVTT